MLRIPVFYFYINYDNRDDDMTLKTRLYMLKDDTYLSRAFNITLDKGLNTRKGIVCQIVQL